MGKAMSDPVSETIATYDAIADDYVQNYVDRSPWHQLYLEFTKRLKGKRVLDLGSGPGHDAKIFADHGLEVTGIDLSKKLLEHAKSKAPNAMFIQMDMRSLDFPDKYFDGVWALASLQHLPKSQIVSALKGVRKVLSDDGIFYLSVTRGEGEGLINKDRYDGNNKYFSNYSEQEITKYLQESGFQIDCFFPEERQDKFWNIFAQPASLS